MTLKAKNPIKNPFKGLAKRHLLSLTRKQIRRIKQALKAAEWGSPKEMDKAYIRWIMRTIEEQEKTHIL